jgi:hypothetical protein
MVVWVFLRKFVNCLEQGSPHEKISPPSMKVVTFKLEGRGQKKKVD